MRSVWAILLVLLLILPSPQLVLATCGGGGGGGGGSQKSFQTTWTRYTQAKADAEKARYGVLLYFLPAGAGDKDEHSLFKTKPISDHSRKSPMVKIKPDQHEDVRKEFGIKTKIHSIMITDWYGNPITPKPFMARDGKSKLPQKKIIASIRSAEAFVDKTRALLKKKLSKGEKQLENKKWRNALKELLPIVELKGFQECTKAQDHVDVIIEEGQIALKEAKKLPADEAKKELRRIAKEFKGTTVEKDADEARAELEGAAFRFEPRENEARVFWAQFRESFELAPLDDAAIAVAREVQSRVEAGARAESAHRYAEAQRLYEEAVRLDPADAVARRYLGEYHRHHSGNWELARLHFRKILELSADSYSRAIAQHGLGKMTIHGGEFERGVAMIEESTRTHPTQLAYRNLAVYWNSENAVEKAREYVARAMALDPSDPYTRVFQAVYMAESGDHERALDQIAETPFDLSQSYNIACVYSHLRNKEKTLSHLRTHFYEYEFTDEVRKKEMWEARTDANFDWLKEDPEFLAVTHLATDETGRGDSR